MLPTRTDLVNHSPTGFEWGYNGSGPAQLALAILADFLHNDKLALELHQHFKRDIISKRKEDKWIISGRFIFDWLKEKGSKYIKE